MYIVSQCLFVHVDIDDMVYITATIIKTKTSSFWWNFHHWLHCKLSLWQLPMQPASKICQNDISILVINGIIALKLVWFNKSPGNHMLRNIWHATKYIMILIFLRQLLWEIALETMTVKFLLCLYYVDGLMQERRNSIANVLELCLSCINSFVKNKIFIQKVVQ